MDESSFIVKNTGNTNTSSKTTSIATESTNTIIEAETKTEKELFEIVKSLSTTEEFGITDDLYSLGFTSLTLMKLNSLIYNKRKVVNK